MSVQLSKDIAAGFPDRPSDRAGYGLLVHVTSDGQASNAGQWVTLSVSPTMTAWHLRVMLNPATFQGGAVTWLAGYDSSGNFVFRGEYDAATRQVSFTLSNAPSLSVTLPTSGPTWHAIQWTLSASAGTMRLWHQGRSIATATGSYAGLNLAEIRLGGWDASSSALGDVYLDELAIGDAYLLPPLHAQPEEPVQEQGSEGARWLVVYNTADGDSLAWAEFYRQQWDIPYANLCGLDLPLDETIDAATFAAMQSSLADYLDRHQLNDRIIGILLGYRVPGYVLDILDQPHALTTQLHRLSSSWPADNPLSRNSPLVRPTKENLNGLGMTARIDAATLDQAKQYTLRAKALKEADWNDPSKNRLWFDPYWINHPMADDMKSSAIAWANGLDRQQTLLPFHIPENPDPLQDVDFSAVDRDGFVFTWNDSNTPTLTFGSSAGHRALFVQLAIDRCVVTRRRTTGSSDWASAAFSAGYAAVAAASRPLSSTGWITFRPLFEALKQGWPLGEAWHLASPMLTEEIDWVGDPLMTLTWPRSGWRIDGPLTPTQRTDDSTIAAILPIDQTTFTLPSDRRPPMGETRLYRVSRLEGLQQVADAMRLLTTLADGRAAMVGWPPLWPDGDGWPVRQDDRGLHPIIGWESTLASQGIQAIELWQKTAASPDHPALAQSWSVTSIKPTSWICPDVPIPADGQSRQFAWRYQDVGGLWRWTGWSAWLGPWSGAAWLNLPLMEDAS